MFETLTDNLSSVFQKLRGRITVNDVKQAMEEIKHILIDADVSLSTVNELITHLKEYINEKTVLSLETDKLLIEKMHKILVRYLSHDDHGLPKNKPKRILMLGLQGSGKTTMCGKIAHKLGSSVVLVSLDVTRPAAKDQLQMIANTLNTSFYSCDNTPQEIARIALLKYNHSTIIFDTAGRHSNESMEEISELIEIIHPDCTIFVADSMSGKSIERIASKFSRFNIDYIALSKIDSDAKVGAILTVSYILKKPIILLGTGEKPSDYELMNATRIANRIFDQGDIVSLAEKAQSEFKEEDIKGVHQITLSDMVSYMKKIQNMGGLASILNYMPGMSKMRNMIPDSNVTNKQMNTMIAIVNSMTLKERRNPYILTRSRKERIAKGSGKTVQAIDDLVKMFTQMKSMLMRFAK